jgi:hypothetical protein
VAADRLHQEAMIDLIEGRLDVELHHPVISPAPLSGDGNRLFRRASRPVSIGVRMEDRGSGRPSPIFDTASEVFTFVRDTLQFISPLRSTIEKDQARNHPPKSSSRSKNKPFRRINSSNFPVFIPSN